MIRSATTRLTAAATAMLATGLLTMPSAEAARIAGSAPRPTGSGGTWAGAVQVPGLAALNVNGYANVNSVSCTWGGYCGAGGFYTDSGYHEQAFVVSGRGGAWSTAAQVPGLAALNTGEEAQVISVSCTSAGNCAAGGDYLDKRAHRQPFVVSERSGVWGTAVQVPGSASLNPHARAMVVSSVSCASAGNCTAGGWYTEGVDRDLVFVVRQRNGVWGTAMRAPGIAPLDAGFAFLSSVSCVSAGTCSAGGFYTDASRHSQPFVVDERRGVWGRVMPVPGSAALNTGGYAGTNSVSCASAGECVAVGWYSGPRRHAFVARERDGVWRKAIPVPGLAVLNNGGGSYAISVSCASAGNCAAGGWYKYGARSGHWQAFVVGLVNGRWGKAKLVPGSAILNTGGRGQLASVSCYSAGNCAAGGYYTTGSGLRQAFVVSEHSGVWGKAIPVPGLATLSAGGFADLLSVSCGPAGTCAAGGQYINSGQQAFVVSRG